MRRRCPPWAWRYERPACRLSEIRRRRPREAARTRGPDRTIPLRSSMASIVDRPAPAVSPRRSRNTASGAVSRAGRSGGQAYRHDTGTKSGRGGSTPSPAHVGRICRPYPLLKGGIMRKRRKARRREARRAKDRGRWAVRIARDDVGSMTVTSAAWSLGTRPRPTVIRRAS